MSSQLKRTGDVLRKGAADQTAEYNRRFESVKDLYDSLLANLFVSDFSCERAYGTARKLFKSDEVKFAAVDGTEYTRPLFDMVIFFGGSYAARGVIELKKDKPPKVNYTTRFVEQGRGISSCIPLYVNKVVEIDKTLSPVLELEPTRISVVKPLTDESIVNNSSIASWIMAFSEIYLAYKLASNPNEKIEILFLDRSLTCMQSSLMYDTSRRKRWKTHGSIFGFEIDGVPIDMNDLAFGRHRILNESLKIPSPRGDYLRYSIVYSLEEKNSWLSFPEICEELGVEDGKRRSRVLRYIDKSVKEDYLEERNGRFRIKRRYKSSWSRLKRLVNMVGSQLFEETSGRNPLQIRKGDRYYWLTTQDLAFLTLFCLYMLIEKCWNRRVLLIGITKDTASRDFKNHVIPVFVNQRIWKHTVDQDKMRDVPNTDRMFLQSISLFNHEKVRVPWSLVEYDSAFRTIIPDLKNRMGYVSGAIRNRIIPEKLFVKSYIQLSQAKYDPQLRSNVLFIDRLVYPDFDLKNESKISLKQDYGGATEPIDVLAFRDKNVDNEIQNLVMIILEAMTSPSIPEVFGHNKPLFIADKVAKWNYSQARKIIDTTGQWIINRHDLRKFVFYMSTFRERRSQIEAARREI
ncbi:MAG: hypothetical protein JSV57_06015 [Candidatus Bathyarchaeota archaeon]|nr:MAG: hypothetical protein JSV57_06015 [Candidatus Bathyarchaeota archaeon]